MNKKFEEINLDKFQVSFTQRNVRNMLRQARSVLNRDCPSPSYLLNKNNSISKYIDSYKEKQSLQRKKLVKKLSKSNKIKIPVYKQFVSLEKRTINNDDETFLTRSNDSKTIREHLKKKKLKYLDIKEIKGIEEGLVATKTKLKEKLKTVLDSPKNRNSVKWNIQNMKLQKKLLGNILIIEPQQKVKRGKTQLRYSPWQTKQKQDSFTSFFPGN